MSSLSLVGCARYYPYSPSPGAPSRDEVVGTWVREEAALELRADGTATIRNIPLGVLLDSWRDPSTASIDGTATWEFEAEQDGFGDKYLLLTIDETIHSMGGEYDDGWGPTRRVMINRDEDPALCIANGDPDGYQFFCLAPED